MMMRWLLALPLFALCTPVMAQKEFGFDNRKGSGQPYLTPAETVAKFKVPPEFEVKLFAGEPDCINPVAFSIDEKGRVWVLECFEYPSKTPKGKSPRDRIVILEDTDGDGVCDKRTVFAEGKDFPITPERQKAGLPAFDLATGLEVGHGGVWVGAPPYVWFIENKDDKPGKFEPVLGGFGSQDTHETLNTFQWGPDGWLYGMQGVFSQSTVKSADGAETRMNAAVWRLHPKTKKFEIYAEGTSNPWGMDWRNTDGQFILACCVIPHLYHIVPGGIYKRQAGTSYNPHAYGYIDEISDHTFHKESGWAHAGLISLDVPHMPERFRNSVIFGSIHGCSLKQNVLKPNGSSYTASRGDDFLTSGDKNVRPINLKWGPNGDIYLIDWHDQNPCHQARAEDWDYSRGRVYRIALKDRKGGKTEDLSKKTPTELRALVGDPDPYRSRTAGRLLSEAKVPEDARLALFVYGSDYSAKSLRGDVLAGLALGYPWPADIARFGKEQGQGNREVRDNSEVVPWTELLLRGLSDPQHATQATVKGLADLAGASKKAVVHRELASAAVRLSDKHDVTELVHALMLRKEDANDPLIPKLTWLAYEKVLSKKTGANSPVEKELSWLAEQAPTNQFVRDQIVPKAMRRLVATGQPRDLELCVKFVADCKDLNTREKALDGLSVALAGQTVAPPAAWAALQSELARETRLAAFTAKLAVSFQDPVAVKKALALAGDGTATPELRVEALRQLAATKVPADAALTNLVRSDSPMSVRVEAARALASSESVNLARDLLKDWATTPKPVQLELVNVFAGRKPWATAMLTAMEAKTLDRGLVTDNTILRVQGFNDANLNALIEAAWGRTRTTPADLLKTIDKMRGELNVGTASFAKGKAVFEAQCMKCHQFEGRGQSVGPLLDGAARDIEYLLANVIDPNRVIGAPYFLRIANTLDGRVEQGILAEEDELSITLKVENGVLKRLKKADLDGPVKVVEKSMMPEGLTAAMTTQDFRDLVRYVMANPYVSTVTVNGQPTPVPASGRLTLTGDSTVEFTVTAAKPVTTQLLLVGTARAHTAKLDGVALAAGADVKLSAGEHTVTLTLGKGDATVRLLDPDRALSFADAK